AVAGNGDALLVVGRCLDVPDQRLDRFELAEVEGVLPADLLVLPVCEQLPRHRRHARIAGRPPRIHALADAVDEVELDTADRVVAGVENLVAGRATTIDQFELAVAL